MGLKNKVLLVSVIVMILTLVSCEPNAFRYRDEHQELYAAANYSVFGMETRESDRVIEVEKDSCGRVLYLVLSGSPVSPGEKIVVLGIVQAYTDAEVQYYENRNVAHCLVNADEVFPFTKETGLTHFTKQQIDDLKEANDWEKEFDESKCTKQPVCTFDEEIQPVPEAEEKRIVKDLFGNAADVSIDYLAPYSDGTIAGLVTHRASEVEYYVLILAPQTDRRDARVVCEKIDGDEDCWQCFERLLSETRG